LYVAFQIFLKFLFLVNDAANLFDANIIINHDIVLKQ